MCLTIFKHDTTPEVAENEITCYKVLIPNRDKKVLQTPFMLKQVKLGKTYKEKGPIHWEKVDCFCDACEYYYQADEGLFHTFKTYDDALAYCKDHFWLYDEMFIVECRIPKGTEYYEGVFHLLNTITASYGSRALHYTEKNVKVTEELATIQKCGI